MNRLEQLIWDHLAEEVKHRPYIEVADLLHDEPFLGNLAEAIFDYFED